MSKTEHIQEELIQESWLWICAAPDIYDVQSFCDIADMAMQAYMRQERKDKHAKDAYYHRLSMLLGKYV
jgi:hypothetical protein